MSETKAVIILTFNEALNLPKALDSVRGWADEVFVVDSYSTDETVDIALARASEGVYVVQHAFENYSSQWNWALDNLPIKSKWTLKLDADERATAPFRHEIDQLIAQPTSDLEGVMFRRTLFFVGAPMRFGMVQSSYDLRFWKTGAATFENRTVNEHAMVKGRTVSIRSFVEHHDYKSISHWLDKHNRYSSLEARATSEGNVTGDIQPKLFGNSTERRMWLRRLSYRLPCRSFAYFLYRYIFNLGFLDGKAGFRYALLHACYHYWIDLKRIEYAMTGDIPEVIWPSRGAPHPRVVNSDLQRLVDQHAAENERSTTPDSVAFKTPVARDNSTSHRKVG